MDFLGNILSGQDLVNKDYVDKAIPVVPTKLSELTDDILSGKYLLLSGGTVTGTIEFTASTPALKFYRDYGNVPYIHFGASPTSGYGEVGADKNGNLVFWSLVSGNSAYNAWNTVLHAKNIGDYALKKVANVTSLNTNAGEFFYSGFRPAHIPYGNYVGGITLQTFRDAENDYRTQLAFSTDAKGFVRSYTNGSWSGWKTIAFTDSNVASATKLETARKLWGQSFDGTGNIGGSLYFDKGQAALLAVKPDGTANMIFAQVNPEGALLLGQQIAKNGYDTRIYGNNIGFCYGTAGSSSATAMTINSSGNVTIGASDTAGTSYKLRVDGESRFTDRVSVTSLRIVPVNGSFAADFAMDGSSLTLNRELKFTNVTASDICSGIAAAFKTSLAQAENLIARNIILGASSGSASNLAFSFQKYTSVSNTAPNGLTTLMTLTTDGNLGIGTTSPAYKLDVNGTIRFAPRTIWGQSFDGTGDIKGSFYLGGDYGLFLNKDQEGIYLVDTGINWHNSSNLWAKSIMQFNSSGNVTIGGSDLAGTSSYAKLCIDGVLAMYNHTASRTTSVLGFSEGNLYLGYSDVATYNTVLLGKNVVLNPNGNVGIGTTSPQYKLDVVGKARVSDELIVTYPTGFRWAYGDYGVLFRNDANKFYVLLTDAGGALSGSWNALRPFAISLTTGDVTMGHNLDVNGTIKSSSVICGTTRLRVNSPTNGGVFGYMDAQLFQNTTNVASVHIGSCYGGSTILDNTAEYPSGVSMTAISIYRGRVGIGKRWSDTELRALHDANCSLGVLNNAHIMGNLAVSSIYSDNGQSGAAGVVLRNEGGIEITHASTPYIDFHHEAGTTDFSHRLIARASNIFAYSGNYFCPWGSESLGASSYRWKAVYAKAGNFSNDMEINGALTVGAGATFNGDVVINGNLIVKGDVTSA